MKWLLLFALGAQCVVLASNLLSWKRRRLPAPVRGAGVLVSVLIPARNELHNLPRLLTALKGQQHPPLEILVCDDGSDDGTTEWLAEQATRHRAAWFRADPKPEGWIGKNWACHQLGQRARGDWLLFLDADVEPAPDFLGVMAAVMQDSSPGLVTVIPKLAAPGVLTGLVEALPFFSVFTLLPLRFAEDKLNPAFAFADGQVMGFRRADYQKEWPHQQVRDRVLEDVELARWTKQRGRTAVILDATPVLTVRMYRNLREALDGFSKNMVSICHGVRGSVAVALLTAALYLLPLLWLPTGAGWAWAAALASSVLFGVSCWMGGLPLWYGPLYPVSLLLAEWVIGRSILWHRRGEVRWKGRVYRLPDGGR